MFCIKNLGEMGSWKERRKQGKMGREGTSESIRKPFLAVKVAKGREVLKIQFYHCQMML